MCNTTGGDNNTKTLNMRYPEYEERGGGGAEIGERV